MKILNRKGLDSIISSLKEEGYTVIGPTLGEGAIVYDEIKSTNDLPVGWSDEHGAGYYRLNKRNDEALFGYVVGPQSWKKFLFPPRVKLFAAKREGRSFEITKDNEAIPRYAFIGVRSCELHAIFIQDRVFNNGQFSDSYYNRLRENIFTIAVNCTMAGGTCFCASMNTGPKVKDGYDLALTEVINENEHYLLLSEGSEKGKALVSQFSFSAAGEDKIEPAEELIKQASLSMGRVMNTDGIKELLYNNHENPQWNEIANRCLSCANCTMVCPTCFCSTVEDVTDLTGENSERWRRWDSCFSLDYSKVAGGNFRTSSYARYRQWMTHKLASWIDQFGTSGCVGCGRCISWCPVGIDITEEVQKMRNPKNT